MAAPSAGNQQPWEFYVVTDPAQEVTPANRFDESRIHYIKGRQVADPYEPQTKVATFLQKMASGE